jgi:aspartyl-tRNA(Asn)/glutamyl-tRNA(Gln) amidotransferase subunit A
MRGICLGRSYRLVFRLGYLFSVLAIQDRTAGRKRRKSCAKDAKKSEENTERVSMNTPQDLADCTATELIELFKTGAASPVEAHAAVMRRIELHNPILKAFSHIAGIESEQSAIKSEASWNEYRKNGATVRALEGVPTSIKDIILTQGMPTLRGSNTIDAHQPWEVDAPATARLKEAGALILGKTTTPEFGCKGETNSPRTGITRNPWNTAKTPGGSSGGTAAAVAAGMGPLSVGTDGAGSVRIPAAFCGNFGMKPSFGRVPAYPLSPFGSVAHLGPHTMSVQDAALMMNVITQPDARDWTSLPDDKVDYFKDLESGIKGLRIAFSPTLGYVKHVHPDVAAAVKQAAIDLEALGAIVVSTDPGFDDPLEITTGLWFLGAWTVWNSLTPAQQAVTDPDFRAEAELGAKLTALDIQKLNSRRGALGSQMRQWMKSASNPSGYDLLITPAVSIPAFDAKPAGHSPMNPEAMLGWTPFSYPFNLTQQPACSIPCGLTCDGLPIGLQIVGPMFADGLVLRAARAYEKIHPILRPSLQNLARS